MAVDDFDIARSSFLPLKADTPLIVDPYAVLPGARSFQRLKPVAGRNTQVLQYARLIDETQLAQRHRLNFGRQLPALPASPYRFGGAA